MRSPCFSDLQYAFFSRFFFQAPENTHSLGLTVHTQHTQTVKVRPVLRLPASRPSHSNGSRSRRPAPGRHRQQAIRSSIIVHGAPSRRNRTAFSKRHYVPTGASPEVLLSLFYRFIRPSPHNRMKVAVYLDYWARSGWHLPAAASIKQFPGLVIIASRRSRPAMWPLARS